ncbi:MAG: DUF1365 domain-containing protein [Chromatiales bacterium]
MACPSPHRLYLSRVMHRRMFPVEYRFDYPVFSLLLDIDRLEDKGPRLLSVNRFNLLAFHEADHGPRDGSALRPWADTLLARHGIDLEGGRIQLLCFPRLLGYAFNPISIWYCSHRDGSPRAVICEVHNTFGEHHFYLLHDQGRPMAWPARGGAEKRFHVSPLIGMEGHYEFRLDRPADRLNVLIRQYTPEGLMLVASQTGRGRVLDDRALLRALARTPLMTFKVMAAIHWQALKIWLRGAPFFPKPEPPPNEVS